MKRCDPGTKSSELAAVTDDRVAKAMKALEAQARGLDKQASIRRLTAAVVDQSLGNFRKKERAKTAVFAAHAFKKQSRRKSQAEFRKQWKLRVTSGKVRKLNISVLLRTYPPCSLFVPTADDS